MNAHRITGLTTRYYRIPLDEPLLDAEHGVQTCFELITATVTVADGRQGTGYTYTGGYGGRAVQAMIEHDLKPAALDEDSRAVESINEKISSRVNYVGRGGIASFAVSTIDIALWDLRCKHAEMPLWRFLGGCNNKVDTYYGGIDLGLTREELVSNVIEQKRRGHVAFKIKLGKESLEEDIERAAAVREAIGPHHLLMVDANASWDLQTSLRASKKLAELDLYWLEEPIEARDFDGYAVLSRRSELPIAMGENLHTLIQHRRAIQHGGIAFPQPDASNLRGITGWLQVATVAKSFNLPVCTHGMQELHVSLLAAVPHAGLMEYHSFPIHRYTRSPVSVQNGKATAPEEPGIGVTFDWDRLEPFSGVEAEQFQAVQ